MDTIEAWAGPRSLRRLPDDPRPPKRRTPSEAEPPEEPAPGEPERDAPPPQPFERN